MRDDSPTGCLCSYLNIYIYISVFSPGIFVSVAGCVTDRVVGHCTRVRRRRTRAPKAPMPRGVGGHAPPRKIFKV